jgi:hypothetical protein
MLIIIVEIVGCGIRAARLGALPILAVLAAAIYTIGLLGLGIFFIVVAHRVRLPLSGC